MYGYILIALLIIAGLWFTFRFKFVQVRAIPEAIRSIMEKGEKGKTSSFQALMVSTASRVGTGNIVGVAGAILVGGPGAVFWMWIIAIVGGASAFVESTLAQVYKKRGKDGSYGGPAYYMKQALKAPALGGIFAVALILTYMGGFNALAAYNLTEFTKAYVTIPNATLVIGLVIAILAAIVILGGGKIITKATGVLVPIMAALYIIVAIIVVVMNITELPGVIAAIFTQALNFKSIAGGALGAAIMQGIKRGLYSNEAGIGSAPNAAAAAEVSHPAKQGFVQVFSVFLDTIIICSATAFMCLSSGVDPSAFDTNAAYIQGALQAVFGPIGPLFITIALALFAYTTLIGNYFYAEQNISYLYKNAKNNKAFMFIYRLIAVIIIFVGAQFSAGLAWDLADVLMGIMALINIPVIWILGRKALVVMNDYFKQKKEGKDPVFHAKDVGIEGTEYWND
ncbi:MAG: alanine:cation symporter family protein [Eubacterium sp.]|nr:alanine:cation symporter family protein [Eubacterium sp.]